MYLLHTINPFNSECQEITYYNGFQMLMKGAIQLTTAFSSCNVKEITPTRYGVSEQVDATHHSCCQSKYQTDSKRLTVTGILAAREGMPKSVATSQKLCCCLVSKSRLRTSLIDPVSASMEKPSGECLGSGVKAPKEDSCVRKLCKW